MPEPINLEILENYETYIKVRNGKKRILNQEIVLEDDNNHRGSKKGRDKMEFDEVDDLNLHVRVKINDKKRYAFAIRSIDLCQKPFFRFDACGPSHRNRSPQTPLSLQSISTPHFQYYDKLGYNTAYKTDNLKNDDFINDMYQKIDVGMKHFCDESKSFYNGNEYPKVILEKGTLGLDSNNDDPLSGINFY